MPGAWLQTPAKTRLMAPAACSYAGDLFLGRRGHGVDAGTHRAVPAHAFAARLDVVGPRHAEQRREVHEQLAVDAEDIELADVARDKGFTLLGRQLVAVEQGLTRLSEPLLHRRLAVEVEEELLRGVEAH